MTTQYQILKVLSTSGPISRNKIGELVGEHYRAFQTQLNRLSHHGLLQDTGNHIYAMTDAGNKYLKGMEHAPERSPEEGFSFTITEADLMMLDDNTFKEAWDLLGKLVRTRYPHHDQVWPAFS